MYLQCKHRRINISAMKATYLLCWVKKERKKRKRKIAENRWVCQQLVRRRSGYRAQKQKTKNKSIAEEQKQKQKQESTKTKTKTGKLQENDDFARWWEGRRGERANFHMANVEWSSLCHHRHRHHLCCATLMMMMMIMIKITIILYIIIITIVFVIINSSSLISFFLHCFFCLFLIVSSTLSCQ